MASKQPQGGVPVTTVQLLPPAVTASVQDYHTEDMKTKAIIRKLAISELVLGVVSMVCGAILTGIIYGQPRRRGLLGSFAFGEGMWCGVWVVVAGSIGIAAGGKQAGSCLINTHMGFAITAAVFSICQLGIGIITALFQFTAVTGFFFILLDLASLASFILLIVSAVFCCRTSSACCQMTDTQSHGTQVIYVAGNTQQPVIMQGDVISFTKM